jgi:hypothetical protein
MRDPPGLHDRVRGQFDGGVPVILEEPVTPGPTVPLDDGPPGGATPTVAVADPTVPGADTLALTLVQQCAWSLAWVGVLALALTYWGSWSAGPWAALAAPILTLVALVGTVMVWTGPGALGRLQQAFGLATALVTAAITQGTDIHLRHAYATDSAAFNQVASRLLLQGHNPYTASMAGAARLLDPPAAFWTYQAGGGHTVGISYPAGSFLLQAPFMGLGVNHLATDWVDLGAWLVTAVLVFCMLPGFLRWLAPLLLLSGVFLGPFANGGTDALFVPFLVVAVWRWDRFPGRSTAWLPSWVGPVCLGIACSIKQTPWFCVPFLVVGVACEARRAGADPVRPALRYAAIAAGAFVVVNLPFILWSPAAWLKGAFLPLAQPLVADGQGLVTLALHGFTGGVVTAWMSAAAGVALLAMVVAFALWESRLRRVWLLLVPFILFLPDRSLANYLTDFVPAALIAALSVTAVEPNAVGATRRPGWLGPVAVGVPALVSAGLLVVAFTSAPLIVTVDGVAAHGVATLDGGLSWAQVVVTVHNTSSVALAPRFMVSSGGGHPTGFWTARTVSGSDPVGPGRSTRFFLQPTRYIAAPPHGQWWIVDVYSSPPDALSTSSLQRWTLGLAAG